MAETEATPNAPVATKKDRSPSFPFITLTKAVERTQALFDQAKRHEMRLSDAASAMGYAPKSSGVIQTLAALIAFGLVNDEGSGLTRKFKVSDLGFKLLADQRPGARGSALAEAALKPKLIAEFAVAWADGRPADSICVSELHIDRGFTEDAAKTFLRVFDDAMAYAKTRDSDKKTDTISDAKGEIEPPDRTVAAGDWVSVETGGQLVFEKTRVRAVDGQWVFVEASETGANMSDVTILEKGSAVPATPPTPPTLVLPRSLDLKTDAHEELDRFTVDEGVVKIVFPKAMTEHSVTDLEEFFKLFIKKAKRRAGAEKPS